MSSHIHLTNTFNTDNFIVKVYSSQHDVEFSSVIDALFNDLNSQQYPRGIIELLLAIDGVNMIRVFDKQDNLILTSSNILPEDIHL
jgi:hypothetical protein